MLRTSRQTNRRRWTSYSWWPILSAWVISTNTIVAYLLKWTSGALKCSLLLSVTVTITLHNTLSSPLYGRKGARRAFWNCILKAHKFARDVCIKHALNEQASLLGHFVPRALRPQNPTVSLDRLRSPVPLDLVLHRCKHLAPPLFNY